MSDLKLFFRYITPSMLGMLIAGVYSIVDIFFVGIAVGEEGLAAISLAFPVVMLVYGIGDMIGTGAGILISRERGCGNAAEANRFFNRMLLMELLAGVLLPLLVIPWLGLILTGSGATPELLPGAYSYTAILLGAGVMQMVAMGLMTAIRNDGRPILAMWLVVVGLVGNIGLDALFMIGLGWGLVGAAVATVLAQGMAMLCSLGYFFTRYAGLGVRIREMRLSRECGRILSLGIPTFGNQLSIGAMLFFHNWQSLAYGGVVALAAYTVISTVESVGSMLMTGMGTGVQPLVSYFFGGGRCRRGHRIGNYGMVSRHCDDVRFHGRLPLRAVEHGALRRGGGGGGARNSDRVVRVPAAGRGPGRQRLFSGFGPDYSGFDLDLRRFLLYIAVVSAGAAALFRTQRSLGGDAGVTDFSLRAAAVLPAAAPGREQHEGFEWVLTEHTRSGSTGGSWTAGSSSTATIAGC